MIIFCEQKYAEKLISKGFETFMSPRDLGLLAKYYKYMGKDKKEIFTLLVDFCKTYNPEFNEVRFYKNIQKAVNLVDKYKLRLEMQIPITKKEIETIKSVKNHTYEKVLFTMLAASKYFKMNPAAISPRINKDYVHRYYVNIKFTEILKLAKIHVTKDERNSILFNLQSTGLINTSLNGTYEICFVDPDGETELFIEDMDNVVDFYPFYCEDCGKKTKKAKNHDKCRECYSIERSHRNR